MNYALINRVERRFSLGKDDRAALNEALDQRVRRLGPHHDIIREGDRAAGAIIVLSGWACCHKSLPDGRRQITSLLLPGDIAGIGLPDGSAMDHSVGALSPLTYVEIPSRTIAKLAAERSAIENVWKWLERVEQSTQREWSLNVGQRQAFERVAHLLCEIFTRLAAAGRSFQEGCEFPITQIDLGRATGLTAVHVNRTLKKLRALGLIVLKGGELQIHDFEMLKHAGLFSEAYLHLDRNAARTPRALVKNRTLSLELA